jgi:hypothetical protein
VVKALKLMKKDGTVLLLFQEIMTSQDLKLMNGKLKMEELDLL